MNRDDDQDLWDLLGRNPAPTASPFFARNVLREIRRPNKWEALRIWFNARTLVPATSVAVALLAVFLLQVQAPPEPSVTLRPDTTTLVDAADNDLIADLDDLVDPDDNASSDDDESVLL